MTGPSWARLTLALVATSFLTVTAHAGDNGAVFRAVVAKDCAAVGPEAACLGVPLTQGSAATALDVLRDIYPGLRLDGKGSRFAGAEAVEAASDPDAGAPADRTVDIGARDAADIAVIDAGKTVYAAAVSGGVVAVAQIKPAYKPLGRLQVATDPGGSTNGFRLLLAAPDNPLAVTISSHFNSQEGYDSFHLVGVVGGQLVDLYDGPYIYSLAEATEHCELLDHREVVASFEVRKQSHHGLADIGIAVDYTATCINGEKRLLVERKSFPMRLAYDGTHYDGDSSALDDFNSAFTE